MELALVTSHSGTQSTAKNLEAISPAYKTRSHQQYENRESRFLNPAPVLGLHGITSSGRGKVESYIQEQFASVHNAKITEFMPWLISAQCLGNLSAVAGFRAACKESLFLEHYLDSPVEQAILELTGETIYRHQIVEIGNLVATHPSASQLLFVILPALLQKAGFEWVVFTGTRAVQKNLARLHLDFHILCEADCLRLPEESRENWGSYYQNRPKVIAANIPSAMEILKDRRLSKMILGLFHEPLNDIAGAIAKG